MQALEFWCRCGTGDWYFTGDTRVLNDIDKCTAYYSSSVAKADILQYQTTVSIDPGDIIGGLLKCWFLQPIRSESMKLGSDNENLLLSALPSFFKVNGHISVAELPLLNGRRVCRWAVYVCKVNHTWERQYICLRGLCWTTFLKQHTACMPLWSSVDCTENLCTFYDSSSTWEFSWFPCWKTHAHNTHVKECNLYRLH